jgi:hypothetical protein
MEKDDEGKYFDPKFNPMIPESTAEPFPENKDEDPDAKYFDPKFNPVIVVGDVASGSEGSADPAVLAVELDARFPAEMEIKVGAHTIVRMAAGNFTVDGKPLAELPAAELKAISAALKK